MREPPEVRELSPRFRMIVGAVVLIGAAIFFFSLHHGRGNSNLTNIKEIKDGWWMHQSAPTPAPTPRVMPTPTLKPIVIQAPPKVTPPPQPKICQICIERTMRYYKAIETGFGADVGNTRQIPQFGIPNAAPTPVPSIFAYQAVGN